MDRILVKGKEEPVNVFEPIGKTSELSEAQLKELESYHSAIELYRSQSWDDAETVFKHLLSQSPDTRIYQIYLERITENKQTSLPSNWDGTFRHTSK